MQQKCWKLDEYETFIKIIDSSGKVFSLQFLFKDFSIAILNQKDKIKV